MGALTKEVDLAVTGGIRRRLPLKADANPFAGSLLSYKSGGYAAELTAAEPFAGVAVVSVPTGPGADGGLMVEAITGIFFITAEVSGIAQTDVDAATAIYASDDGTLTTTSSSNTKIGNVAGIDGSKVIICCATVETVAAVA